MSEVTTVLSVVEDQKTRESAKADLRHRENEKDNDEIVAALKGQFNKKKKDGDDEA